MECVDKVDSDRVEEKLVVPDAGGLVLLFEDLVIVDAWREVVGAVPIGR